MKKMLFAILAMTLLFSIGAMAQANTSTGAALQVTANLQSSIYMTLENATGGPVLSGASTSNATLDFGNVYTYGTYSQTGVIRTVNTSGNYATGFTLATNFGVKVGMYNLASSLHGYGLTAALQSADAANTWAVDSTTLSTSAQPVTGGSGFGSVVSHSLALTIPQSTAAGAITNTINLVATAQ